MEDEPNEVAELTAYIVTAYVAAKNGLAQRDLPTLISRVSDALKALGEPESPTPAPQEPAVPVRASVKPDAITCLECGKPFKSLKRHIRTEHQIEPNEYRAKWSLKQDYPMVAPNYAESRSNLAKQFGLGRKPKPDDAADAGTADVVEASEAGGAGDDT
jgi:predicted transcriptional regulator